METVLRQFLDRYVALSGEEMALLKEHLVVRQFPKRAMIVGEGEVEQYLNLVIKGIVRKFFYKGPQEVVTQLADEGCLISSSVSFLSQSPSEYCLESLEPVTLLSLSKNSLETLYTTIPKMERLGRLITIDLYLHKEEIEQDHICLDVKERFLKFVNAHGSLLQRVPQKYVASYLNIKPETFSRLKHHLKPSTALTA
jgi:CRP-like cAMP-binding protein